MKRIVYALLFFGFVLARPALAIYDPASQPNNKFGIHVADMNDLSEAAKLVNSTGGQWGYVTFVIADNDRDVDKWQKIFRELKRLKLIPLVRLATHVEGNSWKIPQKVDAGSTADFLQQLPWPTKNRYVILFNEPNHAKEWGNTIDPEGYADISYAYAQALKNRSDEYFILQAGMDASAPNGPETMDEQAYILRMANKPELFATLDGWTSHSYPNPGFSGAPTDTGQGSLKTYDWELSLLSTVGVKSSLPIFITETGWAHTGTNGGKTKLSPETIASYITTAASTVWNDQRIVAVTPFLLQYPESLFSMFSWLIPVEKTPYPFYLSYQAVSKTPGDPLLPPSFDYLALLSEPLSL